MPELILEFGCESCYLQDLGCGSSCADDIKIDLNPLFSSVPFLDKYYKMEFTSFTVKKEFFKQHKADFIRRVEMYNPCIILNACTGDETKSSNLKYLVKQQSIDHIPCNHRFNTAHPSYWHLHRYCKQW